MYRVLALAAAFALCGGVALGNDSSAELATGGLVLTKSAKVELRAEELYVSEHEIRVDYRFFNSSAEDITTLVAFPMPDISVAHPDEIISVPTQDPENLLGFSTQVDGKPITARVEQKVLAGGIDRTDLLKKLGVPLAPHLRSTYEALDRMRDADKDELVKLGLADLQDFDQGQGMERHLSPHWSLKTTYYWEQTFPAGTEVAIAHRYKPSVGATVQTSINGRRSEKEEWFADYRDKYCIDADFLRAVERAVNTSNSEYGNPFAEQRISYILTTGSNWSGPIGRFRLVVDKADTSSLVSFCGTGVRKVGATEFEMIAQNFLPEADLHVLILKRIERN